MQVARKIEFFENHFMDFYLNQTDVVQQKIDYVFRVVRTVHAIPGKFLKHLEGTNGLYEIKVEWEGNIFRIFCCFDKGNLVVLFNAFQKKDQKTPKKELEQAVKLKSKYFSLKK